MLSLSIELRTANAFPSWLADLAVVGSKEEATKPGAGAMTAQIRVMHPLAEFDALRIVSEL